MRFAGERFLFVNCFSFFFVFCELNLFEASRVEFVISLGLKGNRTNMVSRIVC